MNTFKILKLCSFPQVIHQVSYTYKATCKLIF